MPQDQTIDSILSTLFLTLAIFVFIQAAFLPRAVSYANKFSKDGLPNSIPMLTFAKAIGVSAAIILGSAVACSACSLLAVAFGLGRTVSVIFSFGVGAFVSIALLMSLLPASFKNAALTYLILLLIFLGICMIMVVIGLLAVFLLGVTS